MLGEFKYAFWSFYTWLYTRNIMFTKYVITNHGIRILWISNPVICKSLDLRYCKNYTNLLWIFIDQTSISRNTTELIKKEKKEMYSPSRFPKQKLWVSTLFKQLFNPKQTSQKQIPILDKVPDVQWFRINHCLILEFLPETKSRPWINSKSIKINSHRMSVWRTIYWTSIRKEGDHISVVSTNVLT